MRRYLLDTTVLSVLVQPNADPRVVAWIRSVPPVSLGISVLVIGEIEKGIARLAPGKRRDELTAWAQFELPGHFRDRTYAVDLAVARRWGQLDAAGRAMGRPLPVVDGLMLATAARHDLVLATRNVSDCAQRGVPVFDPFTGVLHPD
jgi:predicted nucleic acid-binding protein